MTDRIYRDTSNPKGKQIWEDIRKAAATAPNWPPIKVESMTDTQRMEAKARLAKLAEDTWAGLYEDDSGDEQIAFILKALTEVHNAGMEKGLRMADQAATNAFDNGMKKAVKLICYGCREEGPPVVEVVNRTERLFHPKLGHFCDATAILEEIKP